MLSWDSLWSSILSLKVFILRWNLFHWSLLWKLYFAVFTQFGYLSCNILFCVGGFFHALFFTTLKIIVNIVIFWRVVSSFTVSEGRIVSHFWGFFTFFIAFFYEHTFALRISCYGKICLNFDFVINWRLLLWLFVCFHCFCATFLRKWIFAAGFWCFGLAWLTQRGIRFITVCLSTEFDIFCRISAFWFWLLLWFIKYLNLSLAY